MGQPPITRELAAASGLAEGQGAAIAASEQALRGLETAPALIIAFPSGLDPDDAAAQLAAAAPGASVVGMTGNGSIGNPGAVSTGCSLLAFGTGTRFGVGVARGAGRALRRAARLAAAEALRGAGDAEELTLILFVDTRSGDQAEAVAGAHAVAGSDVPIIGGGAGGSEPAQLVAGTACRDVIVALALGSRRQAVIDEAHGCLTRGAPAIVTRSHGRLLLELDGRPAAEVYLERLGNGSAPLSDVEFERIAVTHPLAQPELHGEVRPRHVLRRGPAGSLEIATHIPVSGAVEFAEQDTDGIVAASVRAAAEPASKRPGAVLVFDCAGRKRAAGAALDRSTEALLEPFGDAPPPLAGAFSHGEICRTRGAKGDRNHAVVVAGFS